MATVTFNGILKEGSKPVTEAVRNEVFASVFAAANLVEVEAALSITKGSISGKNHAPSLPGEPPNADTRQLDRSIITIPYRAEMRCEVVAEAPYAAHLEYGTRKMAARPFMRPALLANFGTALGMIQAALDRAMAKL